ncbi:MAG: zinc-ribbon domain-containing protein [Bacillota bacterium]
MASFNDFGKKLSGFVQNASKKSEEMIDNAKLSSEINRFEGNIHDLQLSLGKAYYEKYAQDETCEFADYIVKINALVADIQKRNEILLARKNLRNCPNCQTTVPLNNVFCGKCGMRLPPIEYPVQDTAEEQDAQTVQYTQYSQEEQQTQSAQVAEQEQYTQYTQEVQEDQPAQYTQDAQQDQGTLDTQGTQQGEYRPYTQNAQKDLQAQNTGVFCPQCGAKNEASSSFCAACGQRIAASGGEPVE